MDEFRVVLVRVNRLLSHADRARLMFILASYIPRDIRDDVSVGGTFAALESLLEQGLISPPNNYAFLIDKFRKIGCAEAVKCLLDHQNHNTISLPPESTCLNGVLQDNESDDLTPIEIDSIVVVKPKTNKLSLPLETIRKHRSLAIFLILMVFFVSIGLVAILRAFSPPPSLASCTDNEASSTPPYLNIRPCARWNATATTILGTNAVPGQTKSQLNAPVDVAFDQQGYLYVSDRNNNRIQRFHPSQPNNVTTIVDQLLSPRQIFFHHGSNTLFIAEFGKNRIVRWDLSKKQEGKRITGCQGCSGVVVSSDSQIYIVETQRHRVLRCPFNADRIENCEVFAGVTGEPQRSPQHLNVPTMLAIVRRTLFVIDYNNQRILSFDLMNEKSKTIFYDPKCHPASLIVDIHGTIYSTVTCELPKNDSESFLLRIRPDYTTDRITIDNSHRSEDILRNPHGLVFDQQGHLYVADTGKDRIVRFNITCRECST